MLATILLALVVGALAGVTAAFVVLELLIRAAARQPDQPAAGGPSSPRPHARGQR